MNRILDKKFFNQDLFLANILYRFINLASQDIFILRTQHESLEDLIDINSFDLVQ